MAQTQVGHLHSWASASWGSSECGGSSCFWQRLCLWLVYARHRSEEKADTWQLQIVKPSERLVDDELLTEEQYYKLAEKIVEYRKRYGKKLQIVEADCIGYNSLLTPNLSIQEWRGCECGIFSVSIESDGNVKGCPNMNNSEGNITNTPFSEIWQNHNAFAYNRQPQKQELIGFCNECEHTQGYHHLRPGMWYRRYVVHGSRLYPPL